MRPGDPAHALCSRLPSLYRKQAVLPREAIATGRVSGSMLMQAEVRAKRLTSYQDPELEKALVVAVQSIACLRVLLGAYPEKEDE